MAVPEQTPYIEHTGNSVTTSFALKFQCESKDHLIVLIDDIEPPIATWSLSGGNVVFTTAPAAGKKITLQRNTPFSRTTDYQTYNSSFRPQSVNSDFDWVWLKLQELSVLNWLTKNNITDLNDYVNSLNDKTRQEFLDALNKAGLTMFELDRYVDSLFEKMASIAVDKGWLAEFVVDGNKNQKQINDHQLNKNSEIASLRDYAGNSSGDVSLGLEEALANNSLRITDGEYFIDSSVLVTKDQAINFDFTAKMNFGANGQLTFSGSAVLISKPIANIIRGTNTFTIAHNDTIKKGDLLCIFNPANGSFNPTRDYYKDGEYVEVARVDGDTISILDKLYKNYDATAVDVYKINPISVDLSKINIEVDAANPNAAIKITFGRNCIITDPRSTGGQYHNIYIDRCYNTTIYGNDTSCLSPLSGLQYGLMVVNSQKGRVIGGNFSGSRHGTAFGGGGPVCCVPCRDWKVVNASIQNWGAPGVGAADMHGNCDNVQYIDCSLDGAHIAGSNNKIKNCRITGITHEPSGWGIYTSDVIGGTYDVEDVTIDTTGDGAARGIVYIQLTKDLKSDLTINIKNLKIIGSPKHVETLVQVIVSGGVIITKKVNVTINGLKTVGITSVGSVLRFGYSNQATTAVIPSDYITIDNLEIPSGANLLLTNNVAAATKLRMPEVSGTQNVNTGDGSQYRIAGSEIILPYIYPVVPTVFTQLSPTGESIWNDGALNSGVTAPPYSGVYSYVHSRKVDKLTVGLYSTGNLLATNRNYAIHWKAGIRDI
ncbi:hypothetical protein ACBP83_13020 [Acinetobacter pseudolwoffii]|uniref:phage tailspike polysaccharide lyase family protein n=1 Tax=Acinetobacter pseudolwoffii TaxID=2053287 RepID=UPI0035259284